jgi:hypothetical protein
MVAMMLGVVASKHQRTSYGVDFKQSTEELLPHGLLAFGRIVLV